MDHAACVRELDGETDIGEYTQQPLARRSVALEHLTQRGAGKLLHREVRSSVALAAELVHRNDSGVIEARLHAYFAQESGDRFVVRLVGKHALDRDFAAELEIVRLDDLAHPAFADHGA